VLSNCFLASCIASLVALYFDGSSIRKQMKVMGGLFMAESHRLIAASGHPLKAISGTGGSLPICIEVDEANKTKKAKTKRSDRIKPQYLKWVQKTSCYGSQTRRLKI
jgi:hypothetical protein